MTPAQQKADSVGNYEVACEMLHYRQRIARLIAARGRAGGAG